MKAATAAVDGASFRRWAARQQPFEIPPEPEPVSRTLTADREPCPYHGYLCAGPCDDLAVLDTYANHDA